MLRSISALLLASQVAALLNISNIFSDNAVLQRDKPVIVFGFAEAGTSVQAQWVDGSTHSGVADNSSVWRVTFPATPARTLPFALVFVGTGPDGASSNATLSNLLLGDVFLCSGQSNICAVEVVAMANASDIVNAAASQTLIRISAASANGNASVPLQQWDPHDLLPWQTPIGADGSNASLLTFSAVCYIMGSALFTDYLNSSVPVGLIESAHGGSSLQAWQSPDIVDDCGTPPNLWPSSILWNSNLYPLTVGPMAMKGVYWYQGEEDCGIGPTETYFRADWYGCALRAMITDWRAKLQDDAL
jgi:sialate O-acetylesterase